ncbi:MAG TPA: ABC transporter ATP-binding protein [Thermomicrobiales bacterium]|nr:ABC transporter ATP-binding protein [Thermomicrobiales bacterium]
MSAQSPTKVQSTRQPELSTARSVVDRSTLPPVPSTGSAVVIHNISKTFSKPRRSLLRFRKPQEDEKPPVRALDDISFDVARNEIFGILGANGSGKSTLIRLMSTLLIPDTGTISVFGYDVREDEMRVKRLINRVSVEASFFKKLSAMENLLYALRLYGHSGKEMRGDITRILTALGISEDRVNKPLEQMSRGMQQKVAIARAFLTSPVLLLLDEPTTGLDPRSKKDVQGFVRDLRDHHDATIVICSHDMDEAEALCDRIAIMDNGRVIAIGTVDELKQLVRERDGVLAPSMEDVFIALTGRDLREDVPGEEEKAA